MTLQDYNISKIGVYAVDDAGKAEKRACYNLNPYDVNDPEDKDKPYVGFTLQELIDYIPNNSSLLIENSAFGYQLKDRKYFIDEMEKKNITVYATAQRATPYLYRILENSGHKTDSTDAEVIGKAHVKDGKIDTKIACRKFKNRTVSFYEDDTVGYDRNELKSELIFARLDKYVNELDILVEILNKYHFESNIFDVYGVHEKVKKTADEKVKKTAVMKVKKAAVSKLLIQLFIKASYLFRAGIFTREAFRKEIGLNAHGHKNQIRASVMNTTNGKVFTLMKSILKENDEYKNLVGDSGAVSVPQIVSDNGELRYDIDTVIEKFKAGEPLTLNDKRKGYLRFHCENIEFRRKIRNNIIRDINRFYGFLKKVYGYNPKIFNKTSTILPAFTI